MTLIPSACKSCWHVSGDHRWHEDTRTFGKCLRAGCHCGGYRQVGPKDGEA